MLLEGGLAERCRVRYHGRMFGVEAQCVLDVSHLFTTGALSFARGLNDTSKIAALVIGLIWMRQVASVWGECGQPACDTKGPGCGCGTCGSTSSWLVLLAVGAVVAAAAWFIS